LWYNCICGKHNFRQPHLMLLAMWYHHLQGASSDYKWQQMWDANPQAPINCTLRDMASHRCDSILPTQKWGQEADTTPTSPGQHKQASSRFTSRSLPHTPCSYAPPQSPLHSPTPLPSPPQVLLTCPLPHSLLHLLQLMSTFFYEHRPCPDIDIEVLQHSATFQPMLDTMSFIQALRSTSTTDPVTKLSDNALNRLCNPPNIPLLIDNPGVQHSIFTYLALEHSSQVAYEGVCCSSKHNFMG
ncbi:hypothetical protein PAXRUDRAFT_49537, partial [Paxillus rubicundulus Ve08.2h10]